MFKIMAYVYSDNDIGKTSILGQHKLGRNNLRRNYLGTETSGRVNVINRFKAVKY